MNAKTRSDLPPLLPTVALGLLLMLSSPDYSSGKDKPQPNIIFIIADDLGWADVEFHGGNVPTPNLGKLLSEGLELRQHYVAPVCSPTRAGFMTGRYWSRFGVTTPTNTLALPFDTVTTASALRNAGYETAIVGKWHLGSKPEWGPNHFGFDHSYGSMAGGVTPWSHFYKKGPYSVTWHRNEKLVTEEGHVTDLLAKEAVQWIENQGDEKPFFLYVPFTAVHLPIREPEIWLDRVPKEIIDEVPRNYAACILHLDDAVGRIVAAVEKAGKSTNTLIVFTSDNGGSTAENNDTKYPNVDDNCPNGKLPGNNLPLRGKKGDLYEGGTRVPTIVRWPGKIEAGTSNETPVHIVDWMPTFCALAGYKSDTERLKWDGADIWPVISEKGKLPDRPLYSAGTGFRSQALRHGDWKLITFTGKKGERFELFNIAKDPNEKNNLADSNPDKLAELKKELEAAAAVDRDAVATVQKLNLILAEDGAPAATIVVADKPSRAAVAGVKILTAHLKQISGADFSAVTENRLDAKAASGNLILVGESELTRKLGVTTEKLGPGGILIRSFPKALVLLGADDATPSDPVGTQYAVTTFLEESLGCRFLWPGELGKVVPPRKTISIPAINRAYTPMLQQRKIRSLRYGSWVEAGLKRLGVATEDYHRLRAKAEETESVDGGWFRWQRLGGTLGLVSGHAFGKMWETHHVEHPEWFAMQGNGSRDQNQLGPDRSRLCVSNLDLIAAIAREKIEELNRKPSTKSVAIGPNDGGQAAFCMCEECKKLDPPEGGPITLMDNTGGKGRTYFEYVSLTDRFVFFWNEIAKRVTAVHPDVWLTADACTHNWATQGLNFYVCAKLHWNPDLNVDLLIDDYCQSGFGPAARPIKRYFRRLEQLTNQIAEADPPLSVTEPYTADVIAELSGMLDEAERFATKSKHKRRVAFLRRGLDYTGVHAEAYRILKAFDGGGRKRMTPEQKAAMKEVLDRNWALSRDILLNNSLAVNVATVAWGGAGEILTGSVGASRRLNRLICNQDVFAHNRDEQCEVS